MSASHSSGPDLTVLDIRDLKTYYRTMRGPVKAVDGISFQVRKGEALGLAGESGCGKTTTALTVMRILPSGGEIVSGEMLLGNKDLAKLKEKQMRQIRWKRISIVFQGAMNALNPLFKVGDQIVEAIVTNERNVTRKSAHERAGRMLELVGIQSSRGKNYPHEFSGGMRQRALIAMSLACNPDLLIADEPGTALDVIVQAQVLKLMSELKSKLNLSMILITHDLSIIAELCEKTAIMYAGKIVEQGDVISIFKEPLHPYTQGLSRAFPSLKEERRRMQSIHGSPPDLLQPPSGCRFHPRCSKVMPICREKEPQTTKTGKGRNQYVACHLYGGS